MSSADFVERFRSRDMLVGTFVKIPAIGVIESLVDSGIDFVVIDQEHAPFGRAELDALLFAARALHLPALVRVPSTQPHHILAALDAGAAGVLIPHVGSAAVAKDAAGACRYAGTRGYSGAVRSARGAGSLADAIAAADRNVLVIAQIEDSAGLADVEAIAASEGIDGLFIGRADLAVAIGEPRSDTDAIWAASGTIADAADRAGIVLAGFAVGAGDLSALRDIGTTCLIYGSDQALLTSMARQAARNFHRGHAGIPA